MQFKKLGLNYNDLSFFLYLNLHLILSSKLNFLSMLICIVLVISLFLNERFNF